MSTKPAALSDRELKARHEHVPPSYYHEGVRRNVFQRTWHRRRIPVITSFLRGRAGRLLDLGCHGGYLTGIINQAGKATVTGIDISEEAVIYARERNPGLTFIAGDIQDPLPFPDASFETVTAFDVLEHIPRLEQVLAEIRRVLVQGGALIVGVPRDTLLFRLVWQAWTRAHGAVWQDVHVHEFTSSDLRQLAANHGFLAFREVVSHWGMYTVIEFRRSA